MKIHCYYHSSDLDGHCSGAIVHKFTGAELFPINYGDRFPWELYNESDVNKPYVFMVDFSLPAEDMRRLNLLTRLVWIDHHKTAIDAVNELGLMPAIRGIREVGKAACELTWKYFETNQSVPLGVKLLGRHDVWDHSDPKTLPFQYRMRMNVTDPQTLLKGNDRNCWPMLLNDSFDVDEYVSEGTLLLNYERQQNEKMAKAYAFETELLIETSPPDCPLITGTKFKAIAINRGFGNSRVFDSVYDSEKHALMIAFVRTKNKKWKVSLYSTRPEVDCGKLATVFGGGGHKGAAGFVCEELPFEV